MSVYKTFLADEAATLVLATQVAKLSGQSAIIYLSGQLGAGKTTFSRGFLQGLGFVGNVKSPTYTIVEPYQLAQGVVNHFDFYRIQDPNELELMGVRDYFQENSICLIEWPECATGLLPAPDIICVLLLKEFGREVTIEAKSQAGETIVKQLKESQ